MSAPSPVNQGAPRARRSIQVVVTGAALVAVFGVGWVAGTANAPAPPPAATPTITKTEATPVTPPSCAVALDLADEGFRIVGRMMGAFTDYFAGKVSASDAAIRVKENSTAIEAMTDPYHVASKNCRGI